MSIRTLGPQFTGREAESRQPKQTEIQRSTRSFQQIRLERLRSTVAVIGDRDVVVPLAKAGELNVFPLATLPFPCILPLGLAGNPHPADGGTGDAMNEQKTKSNAKCIVSFSGFR